MVLADDGDIVRGLGFVTMYAAWVEEDVDDILHLVTPVELFDEEKQRWPISRKLRHAARIVRMLKSEELEGLPEALEGAVSLFESRNEFVHGRIYAGLDRVDYIQGGRPHSPTKEIPLPSFMLWQTSCRNIVATSSAHSYFGYRVRWWDSRVAPNFRSPATEVLCSKKPKRHSRRMSP